MDKRTRNIKCLKMDSFLRAYILYQLCVLSQRRTKTIKRIFYQVHCIIPFPFTTFLRPKVAINVELYLATAMNYYFHAVIGAQFTKHL